MPVTERFLIKPLADITHPWTNEQWWQQHLPSIKEAFKALERNDCYSVFLGPDGVQQLTIDEHDAFSDQCFRDAGGYDLIDQMADDLAKRTKQTFDRRQANSIAEIRKPRSN